MSNGQNVRQYMPWNIYPYYIIQSQKYWPQNTSKPSNIHFVQGKSHTSGSSNFINHELSSGWPLSRHSEIPWHFPDNSLTMCGTHAHVNWYS